MERPISNRQTTLVVLLIALLGAALRFLALDDKSIWLDEAFSIWMASHPPLDLLDWLVRIDQHPPLYYGLLSLWLTLFGDLPFAVRSLSALAGTLAIPFFYGATARFFDRPTGLIAALILAVAPSHVRYGQEARMYALLTLTVAATLYFLARLLLTPRPDNRDLGLWTGLVLAQAAAMLTHNSAAVFFPLALNAPILAAIWLHRRTGRASSLPALNQPDFAVRWLLCQGAVLLLWLPWAPSFVHQAFLVDASFWIEPPTAQIVWEAFEHYNYAYLPQWMPLPWLWNLIYGLLALLGVLRLRNQPARAALLLSLWLLPIAGALLVSLRRPIFGDWTLLWTTLPYYALIAGGIRFWGGSQFSRSKLALQLVSLATVLVLSGYGLHIYYVYIDKEKWDDAAAWIVQEVEPGDLILINPPWAQLPFEYYFRRYEAETGVHGLPVDLFSRGELEPQMTEADIPRLRHLVADQRRVWLITSHNHYADPDDLIQPELARKRRAVERREFVGVQIVTYE